LGRDGIAGIVAGHSARCRGFPSRWHPVPRGLRSRWVVTPRCPNADHELARRLSASMRSPLPTLSHDCRAAMNHFVYQMINGLLGYPLLESIDYRRILLDEPSAAEQACAVFCNVLRLNADGAAVNAVDAEIRAAQYIRKYCDPGYDPDPSFEEWEMDRPTRKGRTLGPMPP
jgi:hypothetical protein